MQAPLWAQWLGSGSGDSLFPHGCERLQGKENRGAELANERESSLCRPYPQQLPAEAGHPEGEGEEDRAEQGNAQCQEAKPEALAQAGLHIGRPVASREGTLASPGIAHGTHLASGSLLEPTRHLPRGVDLTLEVNGAQGTEGLGRPQRKPDRSAKAIPGSIQLWRFPDARITVHELEA